MTVTQYGRPINHNIGNNSVTVPSDEVWQVNLTWYYQMTGIQINGNSVINSNSGGNGPNDKCAGPIVLPPDTTIQASESNVHINGFDVSPVVDNSPLYQFCDYQTDVTVPTGETWYGVLTMDSPDWMNLNGDRFWQSARGYQSQLGAYMSSRRFVFTEGDTLNFETPGAVFGWKL